MVRYRVAIERPHRHEKTGNPYRIRIAMTVPPGKELVVTRDAGKGGLHHAVPTVVRGAFQAAHRRLRKLVERQHGREKTHPQQEAQAFFIRLFRAEAYGFLKTLDDREIYFHRNSVLDTGFDRLEIGTGVRFAEQMWANAAPRPARSRSWTSPGRICPNLANPLRTSSRVGHVEKRSDNRGISRGNIRTFLPIN